MSPIAKVLIGALATVSAVQALPNYGYGNGNGNNNGDGNASATITAGGPTGTPAPPADPNKNNKLIAELLVLPTAIKRFQRLLTAAGEKLLSKEEVRSVTVFDFNNATPAPGAKGGATKAAVSCLLSSTLCASR